MRDVGRASPVDGTGLVSQSLGCRFPVISQQLSDDSAEVSERTLYLGFYSDMTCQGGSYLLGCPIKQDYEKEKSTVCIFGRSSVTI